ncbi:MAG: hypothetical protein H0W83_05515, partial [Planctomycetes bacterium]|nr:hypothetical protein [Planctomycetota bacterium]
VAVAAAVGGGMTARLLDHRLSTASAPATSITAQDHSAMTEPAAAAKASFRYSFNWCDDVASIRRFYHDLLGLDTKEYHKTADQGWVVFDAGGVKVMFMEAHVPAVANRDGFSAQFGYPSDAERFDPSWGIEIDEGEFAAVVARLQAASDARLQQREPAWRQDSYWGLTALDPMGTTIEISVTPKARPASTVWPGR